MAGHQDRLAEGLSILFGLAVVGGLLYGVYRGAIWLSPYSRSIGKYVGGIALLALVAYLVGYLATDFQDDLEGWL